MDKIRNIYALKIIGNPDTINKVFEGLKGINKETKKEELICVDKFLTKIKNVFTGQEDIATPDKIFSHEKFYNIECDRKSSSRCIEYVFGSELSLPIEFIKKISKCFIDFEFVLENKNSSTLNERFRFTNGYILAGGKYGRWL
jgi:hypothetical protein